ncbi:hypothetical protein V2J09_010434 [Rumex salicifolius]
MATETETPAPGTATNIAVNESPEKTLAPTTRDALAPATENLTTAVPPSPSQQISGDTDEAAISRNGPVNDTEKKIRRAERFGVPLQLSEEEKRNSRAERFGSLSGSSAIKSPEELKRKARAERFGQVVNSTVDDEAKKNSALDNEAKKKARLARFGSNAKTDSQEEVKRKARALRFAQSPANSQTKTGCKGSFELTTKKTAVTGSTIGGQAVCFDEPYISWAIMDNVNNLLIAEDKKAMVFDEFREYGGNAGSEYLEPGFVVIRFMENAKSYVGAMPVDWRIKNRLHCLDSSLQTYYAIIDLIYIHWPIKNPTQLKKAVSLARSHQAACRVLVARLKQVYDYGKS